MSIEDEVQDRTTARPTLAVGRRKSKPLAPAPLLEAAGIEEPLPPPAPPPRAENRTIKGVQPISQWFVRCLLAGVALALLTLFKHPVFHFIGVVGPIAATLAYPLIGAQLQLHKSPSQRERFADNCYYLGFIFTQIALLVGFLPVVLFNQEITSQDVLRAFSLALGAALVGLVARTYFIQTGHSISENSQLIEDEVEALAASVSRQAKVVLGQFEVLGTKLTGAYGELNAELATCVGSLVQTVKAYDAALGRDLHAVQVGASAVTDATAQSVEAVTIEQQRFVSSLQEAVRGIEAIRASAQTQMAEATGAIRSSAQALTQGAEAMAGMSAMGERLNGFEGRVETAAIAAERLQTELVSTTERLATAGAEAVAALEGAGRGLTTRALGRAEEFERELSDAVRTLEQTLVSFRGELERVRV